MRLLAIVLACSILTGCASHKHVVVDLTSPPKAQRVKVVKEAAPDGTTKTITYDFTR